MNVEIGTEAVQFPEKEYLNGIFVAVYLRCQIVSLILVHIIFNIFKLKYECFMCRLLIRFFVFLE